MDIDRSVQRSVANALRRLADQYAPVEPTDIYPAAERYAYEIPAISDNISSSNAREAYQAGLNLLLVTDAFIAGFLHATNPSDITKWQS